MSNITARASQLVDVAVADGRLSDASRPGWLAALQEGGAKGLAAEAQLASLHRVRGGAPEQEEAEAYAQLMQAAYGIDVGAQDGVRAAVTPTDPEEVAYAHLMAAAHGIDVHEGRGA